MLSAQVPIKGIRFMIQVLLNGWVLSALLWCIGTGLQSVSSNIVYGWIPRIGDYIVYIGWGCGSGSVLIFVLLMCKYWWTRQSGKIL